MWGLLNPLLVRPSARPLIRPGRTLSALIRPSARPPPFSMPSAHPPVRLSFAPSPPVRPSASRPPARRSPPVCPLPVPIRPSARPPQSAPSASSKNYLPFSSGPKFLTSCTPREIATSAIRGASRSHSGIRVSKFPPLRGQP